MFAALSISGLFANLVGVIFLFRYGMPFHVPTGGEVYFAFNGQNDEDIKKEALYKRWGYVGLVLIILGTLLQAVGVLFD